MDIPQDGVIESSVLSHLAAMLVAAARQIFD